MGVFLVILIIILAVVIWLFRIGLKVWEEEATRPPTFDMWCWYKGIYYPLREDDELYDLLYEQYLEEYPDEDDE